MQTKTKFSRAPRARALAVIALAASVLVTACGGGGGAPSFGISSSTPADGSSEVSRDAPLRLAFSAPVDPATVPGNVTLIGPTGRAAVESAGAGAEVEVRPVHRLMPMAEYELRLGAALRSAQGESPQGGTIRFRTRDGSWQSPQAVDTADLVDADRPHVAINAAGDAIAVWAQGEGIARGFWAARYTPGAGWGGPEPIAPAGAEVLVVAVAGMDAAGRAMVVWVEHEGNRRNLWARRHAVEGGWSVTEPVEQDDSGSAMKPQLAMSPSGHATVVWTHAGSQQNVWYNRYTPGAGWDVAAPLPVPANAQAFAPRVAAGPDGTALAVWWQREGALSGRVWSSLLVAGAWQPAQPLESTKTLQSSQPQLAIDRHGNAIAAWVPHEPARADVWVNRYTPAGGWGAAERIASDIRTLDAPAVAINDKGEAWVAWRHEHAEGRGNIHARRLTASGWEATHAVEAGVTDVSWPALAMDASGNVLVVWVQFEGAQVDLWASRYAATTGWGTPRAIKSEDSGDVLSPPLLVMDAGGNGLAVWDQEGGVRKNTLSSRFE